VVVLAGSVAADPVVRWMPSGDEVADVGEPSKDAGCGRAWLLAGSFGGCDVIGLKGGEGRAHDG
jgi:hypothetical protein